MKNQLAILTAQMNESGILYSEAVREFKKVFITHVLQESKGNQCKAAKKLGMHRNTLSRTLHELELDVKELRHGNNGDAESGAQESRRPPRSAQPAAPEKKAAR